MREPDLLRTYAMRHDSGLHVLAAPAAPEAAESVTPAHVSQILRTLLESYDMIVIDAGSSLDERALAIFEAAETVILPVTPEIAALKAVHALLEYLSEVGSVGLKSTFVLNNLFARDILKLRDVENFLGTKISVELPYDPFLYLKAAQRGRADRHGFPEVHARRAPDEAERRGVRRGGRLRGGRHGRPQARGSVPHSALTSAPAFRGRLLRAGRISRFAGGTNAWCAPGPRTSPYPPHLHRDDVHGYTAAVA